MPDFASDAEGSSSPKFALRNRIITARQSLPESALRAAASAIQLHLHSLLHADVSLPTPEVTPPPAQAPHRPAPPATPAAQKRHQQTEPAPLTIAAYAPVGREPGGPDLPETLAAALAPHSRLLLPVLLDDGDLDWASYDGPLSLRAGPRGLRQPSGPRLGVAAIGEADLIIVPALAVDRRGMRLGRGGGSYDRALARATSAFTVALLHDGELLEAVPVEEHDQPVRATITPRGGLALNVGPDWTK
jgi:5-formyltetrahydrofolate cyclo-ligase